MDVVITLCAEEECPLFLGDAERLHWPMPDPVGATRTDTVNGFRRIRDEIVQRFSAWMAERDLPVRPLPGRGATGPESPS
ncbi:MAG: hypothetical protein R3E12_04290 [Candidatus Eisenbacteria bacterium]